MDGVMVSNHGGRQVDGAIAALDALPGGGRRGRRVDGGAVRLGGPLRAPTSSRPVSVRRHGPAGAPVPVGPGAGGRRGVETVLRMLLAELDLTMALSGAATVADLGPDRLSRG